MDLNESHSNPEERRTKQFCHTKRNEGDERERERESKENVKLLWQEKKRSSGREMEIRVQLEAHREGEREGESCFNPLTIKASGTVKQPQCEGWDMKRCRCPLL